MDKLCVLKDDMIEIYPKLLEADGWLLASPVYISRLSGHIACLLDRVRACGHGNLTHGMLRNKVGGALATVWMRHVGVEMTLLTLQQAFWIFEMIPVGVGFFGHMGAGGLTSIGGAGEYTEDDKHLIYKDKFGMLAAREMGKRIVEVAKIVKIGKAGFKDKIKFGDFRELKHGIK